MRIRAIAALLILLAGEANAAGRKTLRGYNISLQPAFTLLSAALQRKIHSRSDVWKCLAAGAVAGYGFSEAKVNAARGDVRTGWFIANAASSVSANAAAGRHPLGRLRWTMGPVHAELTTPLEREIDRKAFVHVGLSLYETGALIYMSRESDLRVRRDGLISFSNRRLYDVQGTPRQGMTAGIFPGVSRGAGDDVWNHEVIHAIQSLQIDSVEPPLCAMAPDGCNRRKRRPVQFDFELGVLPLLHADVLGSRNYDARWVEIEAWRLAQGSEPR